MSEFRVRPEQPGDAEPIGRITRAAFANQPYSTQTEALIVDALRRGGALSVSLVAEREQQIVGHVAFSPVSITDDTPGWFGLGPLSVSPACQGQGIGQALVRAGLAALRDRAARGCVVLGEPAYYARFGFRNDPSLVLADVPQAFFMALPLAAGPSPAGAVSYHPAFDL